MSCIFGRAQRAKEEQQVNLLTQNKLLSVVFFLSLTAVILSFPLTQMNDPSDMTL